ncbi:hypothetical protein [Peribacillus butanolivorans]|uniref:DUF342 domain-containing protein n=1 Tax=Peribacillus butanolivorans TaxID=421767 RepID=A0ABN5N328_9BACI|nr:hypothetical protein [Peribacillus butanolivorans]AXN39806.1 hypothetical protein DTO10_16520 [Peribacillus butanolivorans]
MKIRITKASDSTYWYADKIGEEFTVIPEYNSPKSYTVKRNESCGSGGVLVGDCEIVNEEVGGMKTIKRKANVGERILITNKVSYEDRYENGSILLVTGEKGNGIYTNEWLILHKEYEVIIEGANEMGVIEQMQAELARTQGELAELKSKVAALECEGKRFVIGVDLAKSPQQIRDEIVAKAKADVAHLIKQTKLLQGREYNAYFSVNFEKRTVAARFQENGSRYVTVRGTAKADPSDCFNVHIGKAIALRRALDLEVPAEYYNAPAPTEVRVGDVVERSNISRTVVPSTQRIIEGKTCQISSVRAKFGRIIDDSREDL